LKCDSKQNGGKPLVTIVALIRCLLSSVPFQMYVLPMKQHHAKLLGGSIVERLLTML